MYAGSLPYGNEPNRLHYPEPKANTLLETGQSATAFCVRAAFGRESDLFGAARGNVLTDVRARKGFGGGGFYFARVMD